MAYDVVQVKNVEPRKHALDPEELTKNFFYCLWTQYTLWITDRLRLLTLTRYIKKESFWHEEALPSVSHPGEDIWVVLSLNALFSCASTEFMRKTMDTERWWQERPPRISLRTFEDYWDNAPGTVSLENFHCLFPIHSRLERLYLNLSRVWWAVASLCTSKM